MAASPYMWMIGLVLRNAITMNASHVKKFGPMGWLERKRHSIHIDGRDGSPGRVICWL